MSTIVYQELQFIEPRTFSLKLNSTKFNTCNSNSFQDFSSKSEYGASSSSSCSTKSTCSWSEIEALSSKKDEKNEPEYVHPLLKKSSFKLSEKGLEMCTESLGNETGSCAMDSSFLFPPPTPPSPSPSPSLSLPSSSSSSMIEGRTKPRQMLEKKKELSLLTNKTKFPPPLTTISGSNPIQVRPYREEGRLVIEAVRSPTVRSYMQAERSNGTLKLSLVRNYYSDIDLVEDCSFSHVEEEFNDAIHSQTMENEGFVASNEESPNKNVEENFGKKESERCTKGDAYLLENSDFKKGITVEFGVNFGLGKLQRPSRCKEGSQGNNSRLINWEPFWVAT